MISDRDKKLLAILLIVAILGGSFWLFNKTTTGNAEYEQELRQLKEKRVDLDNKNLKKMQYETDTALNKVEFNTVFADYNTWLSQEHVLVFLSSVEKNTGVKLNQMSLGNVTEMYKFGRVRSSNPAKLGNVVYQTDNIGITTSSNVSYSCTYKELKTVLAYLKENGRKVTIDNMSYTYDKTTDKVTGTMGLSFYAIAGSDRPIQEVDIKDVFIGTENIFASSTFVSDGAADSYKEMISSNYDIYLMVNRTGSDMDTVICGQSGDVNNQKVVSSNAAGIENVIIKVTGRAGDYKISYQVGSKLYPAENYDAGEAFVCGESIELLIMSSHRGASADTTEVSLSVINETDLALNAAIVNDDPELSRINVNNVQGAVVFYQ